MDAAARAGVPAVCGFNYRYVPAMRLAREIVERGELGDALHVPGRLPPGPCRRRHAAPPAQRLARGDRLRPHRRLPALPRLRGGGGPGDDGEADLVRARRRGRLRRRGRPARRRHRLARGVARRLGLEGPPGRRVQRHDRLAVVGHGGPQPAPRLLQRATRPTGPAASATSSSRQPDHPFLALWWPPGHTIGWEHSFVHEWRDFLRRVIEDGPCSREQATFEDGYQAAVLCDAILDLGARGTAGPHRRAEPDASRHDR